MPKIKAMISLVSSAGTFYDVYNKGELFMDVLKGLMLPLEQFWLMLIPVFTQGTIALNPLVRSYPWIVLFGAFVCGIIAITAFRILSGVVLKLILLPVILVLGYLLYLSGSQIFNLMLPLVQQKFAGL